MSYLQKIVFALPFYGKTFSNLIFFTHHCFRIIQFSKCTSFACFVASTPFLHSFSRFYKLQTFTGLLLASLVLSRLSCFYTVSRVFTSYKPQRFFSLLSSEKSLVGLSGLEPPTSRLSGVRSNRLSYKPFSDSQLFRFPLIPTVVEMRRIELLTPCLQGRCSPS